MHFLQTLTQYDKAYCEWRQEMPASKHNTRLARLMRPLFHNHYLAGSRGQDIWNDATSTCMSVHQLLIADVDMEIQPVFSGPGEIWPAMQTAG